MRRIGRIRPATPADLDAVEQLQRRWAADDEVIGFTPATKAQLRRHLGWCFLIAEIGGAVVGFVIGEARSSPGNAVIAKGVRYLDVLDLYVASAHRGRGIGSRLLGQLERRARRDGLGFLSAYTAVRDLPRILAFYADHGFRSWYAITVKRLRRHRSHRRAPRLRR